MGGQRATPGHGKTMMSSEQLAEHLLQHREAFLAFVRQRVADPDLAADILQDSLLKALKNGAQIRDDENLVAWFYRILRHTLIDLYRRRAVRERALRDLQAELEQPPAAEERQSLCACLQSLLPTLKPEYAELIRTVDLGDEPVDTAAGRLGITPNNLNVRLHRARRQLHARLLQTCRLCARHGCLDCSCADAATNRQ
jgi:RNA polymerase sigma factor (sigma-70 family)